MALAPLPSLCIYAWAHIYGITSEGRPPEPPRIPDLTKKVVFPPQARKRACETYRPQGNELSELSLLRRGTMGGFLGSDSVGVKRRTLEKAVEPFK